MIQNVLIGVIAFGVAVFWTIKYEGEAGQKIGVMEISIPSPINKKPCSTIFFPNLLLNRDIIHLNTLQG